MKHIDRLGARLPGFTLTELLIVLIIIGILVLLAIPRFQPLIVRARSTEARMSLGHVHTLEHSHYLMNSRYSEDLTELGFEQETLVSEGGSSHYLVSIVEADDRGFLARAVAIIDFDGDGQFNTWEIDEKKNLRETLPD